MKNFAAAVLFVCIGFLTIEAEAYANNNCFTTLGQCQSTCSTRCSGKTFTTNLNVKHCNDNLLDNLNILGSIPLVSNILDIVLCLLDELGLLFGVIPSDCLSTYTGLFCFIQFIATEQWFSIFLPCDTLGQLYQYLAAPLDAKICPMINKSDTWQH